MTPTATHKRHIKKGRPGKGQPSYIMGLQKYGLGTALMPEDARKALELEHGVIVEVTDYRGRIYGAFHALSNPRGRGFVVYGRGFGPDTYSGSLVMVKALMVRAIDAIGRPTPAHTRRGSP